MKTEEMFVQIEGGRASSHRDDSGSVPDQSMWECGVAKVATRHVFVPEDFGLPLIKWSTFIHSFIHSFIHAYIHSFITDNI